MTACGVGDCSRPRARSPTALGAQHAPVVSLSVLFPAPQVQWQGKGPEAATWLTRDDLVEMGLEKMVVDLDMKEAARAVSKALGRDRDTAHWVVCWV